MNKLKNSFNAGFTLVEILVSFALMSILSLGILQLSTSSNKFSVLQKAKLDEMTLLNLLETKFGDSDVCEANFPVGATVNKSFATLVDKAANGSTTLVSTGDSFYGDSQYIKVSAITASRLANTSWIDLQVTIQRNRSDAGFLEYTRNFKIFAQVDDSNNMVRCMGITDGAGASAKSLVCNFNLDAQGRDVMVQIADPIAPSEMICVKKGLSPIGCSLLATKITTGFSYDPATYIYDHICDTAIQDFSCDSSGFMMKYNSDGTPYCAPLSVDQVFTAFSGATPLDCGLGQPTLGLQENASLIRTLCTPAPTNTPTPTAIVVVSSGLYALRVATPGVITTAYAPPDNASEYNCAAGSCNTFIRAELVNGSLTPIPQATATFFQLFMLHYDNDSCSGTPKISNGTGSANNSCPSAFMYFNPKVCGISSSRLLGTGSDILSSSDVAAKICTYGSSPVSGLCTPCFDISGGKGSAPVSTPTPTPVYTNTNTPTATNTPTPTPTGCTYNTGCSTANRVWDSSISSCNSNETMVIRWTCPAGATGPYWCMKNLSISIESYDSTSGCPANQCCGEPLYSTCSVEINYITATCTGPNGVPVWCDQVTAGETVELTAIEQNGEVICRFKTAAPYNEFYKSNPHGLQAEIKFCGSEPPMGSPNSGTTNRNYCPF